MREGQKRNAARTLRRNSTDVERLMWRLLRDRRFAGVKFRRQVPIGPYVADFASIEHRVAVEVDGGQHGGASDERRDVFLAARGWRVLRFWNNDVLQNRNGVLEHLLHVTREPSPQPSPAARERGLTEFAARILSPAVLFPSPPRGRGCRTSDSAASPRDGLPTLLHPPPLNKPLKHQA